MHVCTLSLLKGKLYLFVYCGLKVWKLHCLGKWFHVWVKSTGRNVHGSFTIKSRTNNLETTKMFIERKNSQINCCILTQWNAICQWKNEQQLHISRMNLRNLTWVERKHCTNSMISLALQSLTTTKLLLHYKPLYTIALPHKWFSYKIKKCFGGLIFFFRTFNFITNCNSFSWHRVLWANLLDLEEEISRNLFLKKVVRSQEICLLMKTKVHLSYDSNDFYLTMEVEGIIRIFFRQKQNAL